MRHAGMSGLFTRVAALAVLLMVAVSSHAALGAEEAKPITYDDHVSAILKKNCLQCHGESKQEAGLNLASYASVVQGGSGGAVVVAGRSAASRMLAVISAEDPDERMPPDNDPLPADQVAMIKTWIDTGLRQNSGSKVAMAPKRGAKLSCRGLECRRAIFMTRWASILTSENVWFNCVTFRNALIILSAVMSPR